MKDTALLSTLDVLMEGVEFYQTIFNSKIHCDLQG